MKGNEMRANTSEELFSVQLQSLFKTGKKIAQTKIDRTLLEHARIGFASVDINSRFLQIIRAPQDLKQTTTKILNSCLQNVRQPFHSRTTNFSQFSILLCFTITCYGIFAVLLLTWQHWDTNCYTIDSTQIQLGRKTAVAIMRIWIHLNTIIIGTLY